MQKEWGINYKWHKVRKGKTRESKRSRHHVPKTRPRWDAWSFPGIAGMNVQKVAAYAKYSDAK